MSINPVMCPGCGAFIVSSGELCHRCAMDGPPDETPPPVSLSPSREAGIEFDSYDYDEEDE